MLVGKGELWVGGNRSSDNGIYKSAQNNERRNKGFESYDSPNLSILLSLGPGCVVDKMTISANPSLQSFIELPQWQYPQQAGQAVK